MTEIKKRVPERSGRNSFCCLLILSRMKFTQFRKITYTRYTMYPRTRITPSRLPILKPVLANTNNTNVNTIMIMTSINTLSLTAIGVIAEDAPRTNRMLKILLPTMFPKAISLSFFNAAEIDVTNSGKEVPIAIIVRPTNVSLMPRE